jgi:hypothetical protein
MKEAERYHFTTRKQFKNKSNQLPGVGADIESFFISEKSLPKNFHIKPLSSHYFIFELFP